MIEMDHLQFKLLNVPLNVLQQPLVLVIRIFFLEVGEQEEPQPLF
jgi:hypothetical protein